MTILGLSFSSLSRHPSSNSLNTFSTDAETYYENASVITNGDEEKNQQESVPKQHPHGNVSLGKGTFFISSSSNKALSNQLNIKTASEPSSTKCTFATIREYLYDAVSKSDTTVNHSWAKVNSKTFQVRSRNYFQDRQKADSAESLFPSRGVDFFTTDTFGPTNIGR